MSTTDDESLPSSQGGSKCRGQPKPYGKVHPTRQLVECPVDGVLSLREYLGPAEDPVCNWQDPQLVKPSNNNNHEGRINIADITTWWPWDDEIAFYSPPTPSTADSENTCNNRHFETISNRELHEIILDCPSFLSSKTPSHNKRVAIVIPIEDMTESAVALMAVMAQGMIAVPLDPRMPPSRVLEAMEQLECTCLVTTERYVLEYKFLEKQHNDKKNKMYTATNAGQEMSFESDSASDTSDTTSELYEYRTHPSFRSSVGETYYKYFEEMVKDIRIVSNRERRGVLDWSCFYPTSHGDGNGGNGQEWWSRYTPPTYTRTAGAGVEWSDSDPAVLLRTSGTTSKPKIVPISYDMLLYGAISLAAALRLKRDDCNCNCLPYYHTGGITCNLWAILVSGSSLLMAGPLEDPNQFLDSLLIDDSRDNDKCSCPANIQGPRPLPTWYYGGPWLHKAIILMAEAKYRANNKQPLPSKLRFIRNAQCHINHSMIIRLSTVFGVPVIPTYAMSEAMPISFSAPIDVSLDPPFEVVDSVGFPLCDLCIFDRYEDEVMEYVENIHDEEVELGEVAVKGAGVITHYLGMDVSKTHNSDGWLRTGDLGLLDKHGRLYIKGRSKEMIKRGGEQVWPNEIDDVVEKVTGVNTACSFGVANELWGEEVAVAVVLADPTQYGNQPYLDALTKDIMQTCKERLDQISTPKQIKYLKSPDELLCGSSGKYIKAKMADHLGITAVDTGALRILTSASQMHEATLAQGQETSEDDTDQTLWEWCLALLETKSEDGHRVIPSDALNGVRFLVTLFVVQVHVGLFPNLPWVKMQGYFPNMMIFFSIGGFQTTCQVARSVKSQWAHFVGTKVGALHSLFVISNLITYPSYVLFRAFDEDGNLVWGASDWVKSVFWLLFCTMTGLGHKWNVNMFTWFQSTYYIFLAMFPFIDDYLRLLTLKRQLIWLFVSGLTAGALWGLLFVTTPSDTFWNDLYPLGWTIVTWLPLLVASMCAAYLFRRIVEYCAKKKEKELADSESQERLDDPSSIKAEYVADYTKMWGVVCDATSLFLFAIWMGIAFGPNCMCLHEETVFEMRPDSEPDEGGCPWRPGLDNYQWTCDITYDEFVDYIHDDEKLYEFGRFTTNLAGGFGYLRCSSPVFLLWCSTMAFGTGYTSRIFSSYVFKQYLAPLGYPVYLVHMSVARYYWVATRGLKREHWWGREGEFPFPVEWWEFFLIIIISIVLGAFINILLVPHLLPHTISIGVKVCTKISEVVGWCAGKCCKTQSLESEPDAYYKKDGRASSADETSTMKQLKHMIRGLTGIEVVSRDMVLKHLGLDSLGATALLRTLRSTVPAARKLTLRQLNECETVGSLHDLLDDRSSASASEKMVPPSPASTANSGESSFGTN